MRTISSLKEELNKFPDDALCYAYEGEIRGIVVVSRQIYTRDHGGQGRNQLGVIHCQESVTEEDEYETEVNET